MVDDGASFSLIFTDVVFGRYLYAEEDYLKIEKEYCYGNPRVGIVRS